MPQSPGFLLSLSTQTTSEPACLLPIRLRSDEPEYAWPNCRWIGNFVCRRSVLLIVARHAGDLAKIIHAQCKTVGEFRRIQLGNLPGSSTYIQSPCHWKLGSRFAAPTVASDQSTQFVYDGRIAIVIPGVPDVRERAKINRGLALPEEAVDGAVWGRGVADNEPSVRDRWPVEPT